MIALIDKCWHQQNRVLIGVLKHPFGPQNALAMLSSHFQHVLFSFFLKISHNINSNICHILFIHWVESSTVMTESAYLGLATVPTVSHHG